MPAECRTCRWWHGDRDDYPVNENGTCSVIHSGGGRRKAPARVYPVGSPAWLETHRTFSCKLHEELRP